MNQRDLFSEKRKTLEADLSWVTARLDEQPYLQIRIAQIVVLRKWESAESRRRFRAGHRWDAEQRYVSGIQRLRNEAFEILILSKVIAARLYEVRRKARTDEKLRDIEEAGIRNQTMLEFDNARSERIGC